ncbi:MAG: hypothetical protein ABH832_00355 [bacterium]
MEADLLNRYAKKNRHKIIWNYTSKDNYMPDSIKIDKMLIRMIKKHLVYKRIGMQYNEPSEFAKRMQLELGIEIDSKTASKMLKSIFYYNQ